MIYQLVIKRRQGFGHPGAWYERPYIPTYDIFEALRQAELSKAGRSDIIEMVLLFAQDGTQLAAVFESYSTGQLCAKVEPNEDAIRQHLEMAPLRETYEYTPPKALWRWAMPQDELRALIRLMGRVNRGELGGPLDGLEEEQPEESSLASEEGSLSDDHTED